MLWLGNMNCVYIMAGYMVLHGPKAVQQSISGIGVMLGCCTAQRAVQWSLLTYIPLAGKGHLWAAAVVMAGSPCCDGRESMLL